MGPNDLRLLVVHPPLTSRKDEPIQCTLYHESLEYTPEYKEWDAQADPDLRLYKRTKAWYAHRKAQLDAGLPGPYRFPWGDYIALSYCWGTGIRSKHIIINGQTVAITETLESALQSVRGGWGSLRLWADAVCIDQNNIAERGAEVRRMRKIYGDAMAVFVHLGPEADNSTQAMQMMEQIAKHQREGTDLAGYALEIANAVFTEQPAADREGLIAIFKLLCRPYFSRMWIIQELAMGDDQVVVGCGNQGIDFVEVRSDLTRKRHTLNYLDASSSQVHRSQSRVIQRYYSPGDLLTISQCIYKNYPVAMVNWPSTRIGTGSSRSAIFVFRIVSTYA